MRKTPEELMARTVSAVDYIMHLDEPFKDRFLERIENYSLKKEVVEELKKYVDKIFVVVFSAGWCKDCVAHVPVLALLAQKIGLKVRVFGGLTKDIFNPNEVWRIPPSPPEAKEFEVKTIPHAVIFHVKGQELGRIVEKPTSGKTMEEEYSN